MRTESATAHFGVVIIGDEILSGRRSDRHLQKAIEILGQRGMELSWARYLGDDEAALASAFRDIIDSGEICFCFGGIGATPDDVTRQSMARAHRVALFRHPHAVREIEQRYGAEAYPQRILMAELPEGSEIIPNPYNRIPGFSLGHMHCLPGFPEMAWPMMEWVLDELYPQLRSAGAVQLILLIDGIRESELIEPMQQFNVMHPDVKLSSLPRFLEGGGYQVEMGVRGPADISRTAFADLQALLDVRDIPYRLPSVD